MKYSFTSFATAMLLSLTVHSNANANPSAPPPNMVAECIQGAAAMVVNIKYSGVLISTISVANWWDYDLMALCTDQAQDACRFLTQVRHVPEPLTAEFIDGNGQSIGNRTCGTF